MPEFVSIAVESPNHYLAVDEAGRIWSGEGGRTSGGPLVITWDLVTSVPASSTPAQAWGGGITSQPDDEDDLEP